ncbi:hypothetical protein ACKKBG_A37885 [Auxenochlorella protothecoides x Auxenochlorella symbiontica]
MGRPSQGPGMASRRRSSVSSRKSQADKQAADKIAECEAGMERPRPLWPRPAAHIPYGVHPLRPPSTSFNQPKPPTPAPVPIWPAQLCLPGCLTLQCLRELVASGSPAASNLFPLGPTRSDHGNQAEPLELLCQQSRGDANPAATGPVAADGHSEPSDDEGRSTLDATPEPSACFSEAQPRRGSSLAGDGASSGDEAGPARRSSALQRGRRRSSGLSAQSLGEVVGGAAGDGKARRPSHAASAGAGRAQAAGCALRRATAGRSSLVGPQGGSLGQSSVQAPAPPRPRTWEEVRAAAEIARRGLLWARLAATPELGAGLRRLERCLASSAGRGEAEGARREDSGGLGTAGLGPLCRWEDAMPGQAMCSAWHPDRPAILAVGFRDARRQDSPGRVAVYCLSRPGRALWQAGVPHGPSAAAWLPGRGALAVGCAMGTITLFRPRQGGRDAGSPICTVPYGGGHGAPVCALVPAAEAGACLASCGKEGTVLHWKGGPEDGLEVGARQELKAPWAAWVTCAAARSPDRAWALGSMEGRLLVAATDQSAPSCSAAVPHPAPLLQLAWHPRRQHVLLSADAKGTLAIWSVESAKVCLVWSRSGPVEAAACVAWHPLQGTCFAAGGADGKASVWDLARSTRFPLSTSTLGCPVTTLAWSPDGRALVCGGEAGAITALAWSAPDLTEGGSQDDAEGIDAVLRVLTESQHESSRM